MKKYRVKKYMQHQWDFEMLFEPIIYQRVEAAVGFQIDMPAASAITAIGSAKGNIFLTPERDAPTAARSGFHVDFGLVEEFHNAVLTPRRSLWLGQRAPRACRDHMRVYCVCQIPKFHKNYRVAWNQKNIYEIYKSKRFRRNSYILSWNLNSGNRNLIESI